jgi:hypothetical protein
MNCGEQVIVTLPSFFSSIRKLEWKVSMYLITTACHTFHFNISTLECVIKKWKDIETIDDYLHHLLGKLKQVTLENFRICLGDTIGNVSVHPAQSLVSFSLLNAAYIGFQDENGDEDFTRFSDTTSAWVSYIGLKYSNLQKLRLDNDINFGYVNQNQIIGPLATALSKLTNLKATW